MSGRPDPILTRFAVPLSSGGDGPLLKVDGSTGLLHEPGAATPFVEELIEMGHTRRSLAATESVLTRTIDPIDPDLLRGDFTWLRFGASVSTYFTKADLDPADPDLLRAEARQWLIEGVETDLQRRTPDPDLLRTESVRERPSIDA